jgi:hypothetical protein
LTPLTHKKEDIYFDKQSSPEKKEAIENIVELETTNTGFKAVRGILCAAMAGICFSFGVI